MEVVDLGLLSYPEAEELQLKKVAEVAGGQAPATLFFCSHPPHHDKIDHASTDPQESHQSRRTAPSPSTYNID